MSRLAFLGTGLIGGGLAEAAAKRGHSVVVWNRTRARAEALLAHGAMIADSPAEAAAGAERVHLALPDDATVEAVLGAAGDLHGPVVVDHSTTAPSRTRDRALHLAGRGVAYLHCPVFMSPQMARDSKGIMLAAGDEAVFERVRAGLAEMTGKLLWLGTRRDKAAAFKLFGNAALIALIGGFADVLAIAAENDFDPADVHGLFDHFNPAGSLAYRGKAMTEGRYAPPSFELAMARKDVRLMIEAAGTRHLAVLPGLADRMDELLERGLGDQDMGILSVDAVPPRA